MSEHSQSVSRSDNELSSSSNSFSSTASVKIDSSSSLDWEHVVIKMPNLFGKQAERVGGAPAQASNVVPTIAGADGLLGGVAAINKSEPLNQPKCFTLLQQAKVKQFMTQYGL